MVDPAPSSRVAARAVSLEVDGRSVELADEGMTLLEALREHLGIKSVKDGCAPQGQCGCCTVLVDGLPRVSCVTPLRRVAGRRITTVDGLDTADRERWADAFAATGASQCGFCSPGIICRLEGARSKGLAADDRPAVDRALAAHLCRCTGWQPIHEAWALVAEGSSGSAVAIETSRDLAAAARRAGIEGRATQAVGPEVALGQGGFADDNAPADALVALPDGRGGWAVGETLAEARTLAGKVQGRRTTVDPTPPLALPPGDWRATLRTSWVEPGYLEPDAAWCEPGGTPSGPLVNGGAFGAKRSSAVASAASALAERHGRAVRVLLAREDVVRLGPKRPPVAAGMAADGTGVMRVVTTPGISEGISLAAPGLTIEEVVVAGPPTDASLRAAGWAEAVMLRAAVEGPRPVEWGGAVAEAAVRDDGSISVRVAAGEVLDEVVLRSYCIGAVHQAISWVRSEGLAVTEDGVIEDLTIRSFGILRSSEMPLVEVEVIENEGEPVNGSDAVFAAVAAAVWCADGCPTDLPARA